MEDGDYQFFINHSDEKVQQVALLRRKLGKSLLDIGPGEGTITTALKEMFKSIEVVEEKEEYCNNLKSRGVICHNCKFEDFETNNRYDVVLASHLLTYLDDKREAIDKMYELLKVGGKILIFNMAYDNLMKIIKEKIHPDVQHNTDAEVQKIVKDYSVYERELIPINITTQTSEEMMRVVHFLSEKRPKIWRENEAEVRRIIEKTSLNGGFKLSYYNVLYTIYKI